MLMDIDTLATIQHERQQALMRHVEQVRLLHKLNESHTQTCAATTSGQSEGTLWATLQQKLAAVFQMRIRPVLPH